MRKLYISFLATTIALLVAILPAYATTPTLLAHLTFPTSASGATVTNLPQSYYALMIEGMVKSTSTAACNYFPLLDIDFGHGSLDTNLDYDDAYLVNWSTGTSTQGHHPAGQGVGAVVTQSNTSTGCYNARDFGHFEIFCPGYSDPVAVTDMSCTWHSASANNTSYYSSSGLLSTTGALLYHPTGDQTNYIDTIRFFMDDSNDIAAGSYIDIYGF